MATSGAAAISGADLEPGQAVLGWLDTTTGPGRACWDESQAVSGEVATSLVSRRSTQRLARAEAAIPGIVGTEMLCHRQCGLPAAALHQACMNLTAARPLLWSHTPVTISCGASWRNSCLRAPQPPSGLARARFPYFQASPHRSCS